MPRVAASTGAGPGAANVGAKPQNGRVTIAQPMLSLWDDPREHDHTSRVVAHSSDRVAWTRARSRGVTATDVAKLSSESAIEKVATEKLIGKSFWGNAFIEHGRAREPEIARWVLGEHGIGPCGTLYHAAANRWHLATPDGLRAEQGRVELVEIKTTVKPWRSIPRQYLRQVFWQQYVLGAERTLVVWEQHNEFVPVSAEPRTKWVDRDDNEIHILVGMADRLLARMRRL
jgi:hypothetical protein